MTRPSSSFVLLYVCLSPKVILDRQEGELWKPAGFYVALQAMDSAEHCLEGFIAQQASHLFGWRLFSQPVFDLPTQRHVHIVNGFQPIVISGEAIAYARTVTTERFRLSDEPKVWAGYPRIPKDLVDLLADPGAVNSDNCRGAR